MCLPDNVFRDRQRFRKISREAQRQCRRILYVRSLGNPDLNLPEYTRISRGS